MKRNRHLFFAIVLGCNFTIEVFAGGELRVTSTGAEGTVQVDARSEEQKGCPLLPHGIGAYSQHACVDHPDHGAKAIRLHEPPWNVVFAETDAGWRCGGETGVDLVKDGPRELP